MLNSFAELVRPISLIVSKSCLFVTGMNISTSVAAMESELIRSFGRCGVGVSMRLVVRVVVVALVDVVVSKDCMQSEPDQPFLQLK